MKLFLLGLCLLSVSYAGVVNRSNETPPHTTIQHDGYEERVYEPRKWVCSDYTNTSSDRISAYMRLHYYTQGNNVNATTIPRTLPVAIEVKKVDDESSLTYCFYLGESFQHNTPKPLNDLVYIKERPEITVITRKFDGFAKEEDFKNEEKELRKLAEENNHIVDDTYVIRATYTPPWQNKNRRNELWVIKA